LPGTQDASFPFWSPDGRFLGFFAEGKLKKIDLAGGPALTLCDATDGRGGSWNQNDVILFAPARAGSSLFRVSAAGGTPVPVTKLDVKAGEISHRFPWFLPDGRHFLFQNRSTAERAAVYFGDLESGTPRRVVPTSSNAVYVPPGYILFTRERTLMAQPFDAVKGEIRGDPGVIAEPVDYEALDGSSFSVSRNGVLVYQSGGGGGDSVLTWFDRQGKPLGTIGPPSDVLLPAISPDGKTVAVEHFDRLRDRDIWLHDVTRGGGSRFTFTGRGRFPVWSPDGGQIAYRLLRNGFNYIVRKAASGAPQEQVLYQGTRAIRPVDWSHDGRFLIAQMDVDPTLKTRNDIWVIPLSGDQKPFPYLQSEFAERRAKLSPNGRWMAYVSDESKQDEVYVQDFPNPGEKWPVSTNGGDYPIWSRDGRELYFIAADQKLMAVEVKGSARFEAGVPKPLFDTRLGNLRGDQWFDVTTDSRFLIPTLLEQSAVAPLTVVLNWQAGLKK
jgi:Tol biopolymer transport system component